jgi:hypothetical protein
MKQRYLLMFTALFVLRGLPLSADGLTFSGLLDSKVSAGKGAGETGAFHYGIEEYANLRMQAKVGGSAVFYGAFNFIAASGASAGSLAIGNGAAATGENYAAAMELERLYFRLNGNYLDFDAGLMRLAHGYGQVWGPSDFLNPRNPLFPDARPRAVLGSSLAAYPVDSVKLLAFAAAPKNPLAAGGEGFIFGLSGDAHWDRASVQVLYAFETPQSGSDSGIHRGGLSLKADLELGFTADLLYTYDHETPPGIEGLAASTGFDYSFFKGNLYVLAEYLYNGASSAAAEGLLHHHYLYTMFLYRLSDYTSFNLALVSGLEDHSFSPSLGMDHELLQGVTLSLSGSLPLDEDLFTGNGKQGELGPAQQGAFLLSAKVRLRF